MGAGWLRGCYGRMSGVVRGVVSWRFPAAEPESRCWCVSGRCHNDRTQDTHDRGHAARWPFAGLCLPRASPGIAVAENAVIIGIWGPRGPFQPAAWARRCVPISGNQTSAPGAHRAGEEPETCRARPTRQAGPDAPEIRRPVHPLGQWRKEGKNSARCEASLTPKKAQAGEVRQWRRGESNPGGAPRNRPISPVVPLSPSEKGHEWTPGYLRGHQRTRNSRGLPTRVPTGLHVSVRQPSS